MIIDISPRISARTAVWPGDVAFSRSVSLDVEKGDNVTLSSIQTTVHVGAHADAPNHYARGGGDIASQPLDPYIGRCQVIEVHTGLGMRITASDLRSPIEAPRVLFKTKSFPDPERFNENFVALSQSIMRCVADAGGRLVGIDTPSVDLCEDAELEAHQAAAHRNLALLEGIVLDPVEPGFYTLIALPLRIEGADASPVRAVLLPQEKAS